MTAPDSQPRPQPLDMAVVRHILAYTRPYRWLVVGATLLTLGHAVIQPQFALIQRHAIDTYLVPFERGGAGLDTAALWHGLVLVTAGYMALRVLDFLLNYLGTLAIGYLGQNVLRDIRADVFGKLQRLQLSYFDRNPVGRLITRVTSDVDAINTFISDGLVSLMSSLFLIVAYAWMMLRLDWRLSLVSFAVLPLMYFATRFFEGKMREAFRWTRTEQSAVNTQLNENISGAMTVQLFGREARSALEFDYANRRLLAAFINSVRWFSLFMPSVQILGQFAVALVVYFAASFVLQDQAAGAAAGVTVGTIFAFVQLTQQLFQPIQDLADVFNNLQAAMASSERIFEVLDEPIGVQDRPDAKTLDHFEGRVDLDNIWFAYDPEVTADTPDDDPRWILRGVDLHIRPGESVALVGATGAGKTSVTALISRFYDVQRGAVRVDGIDVRDLEQADLRRHVGVVLQDVFLFAGTIASNLSLGNPAVSQAQIEEVCRYVGVHDYIMSLPEGYQTEVRERGAGLSTGQKQLLAFARALLQNPDIILVLDEATANVDTETELRIQAALERTMQGRTSIAIAHRLSTIESADRIVVMRRGQIAEEGTHAELLAVGGYYWRLQQLQEGQRRQLENKGRNEER